jgi:hypothetical protein
VPLSEPMNRQEDGPCASVRMRLQEEPWLVEDGQFQHQGGYDFTRVHGPFSITNGRQV